MKKSLLLCTAAAVLLSVSAQAQAAPYVSAKAVYSWEREKVKDEDGSSSQTFKAPGLNAAVGFGFQGLRANDTARVEVEYGYRSLKSKTDGDAGFVGKEKFGMQTYMLNGYYDLSTGTIFKPYVGAGLGMAEVKVKYEDEQDLVSVSKTKFAWNLNAGVGISISKNITIDVGYRYVQVEDFKKSVEDTRMKFATRADEISVGVRFDF